MRMMSPCAFPASGIIAVMETVLAAGVGVASGMFAAVPLVMALRLAHPSVSRGLAAAFASFMLLSACIAAARLVVPEVLVAYAVPAVLSFLVVITVRALHDV